jgi:hypothetical protein
VTAPVPGTPATSDPYPDKVRIEFETPGRDVYAAWKNVGSALEAGWSAAEAWLVYGETVPRTWEWMCRHYGAENLIAGVVLAPEAETRADERRKIAEEIDAAALAHHAKDAAYSEAYYDGMDDAAEIARGET